MKRFAFYFFVWLTAISLLLISQMSRAEGARFEDEGPSYRDLEKRNVVSQSADEDWNQRFRTVKQKKLARAVSSYSNRKLDAKIIRQMRMNKEFEFRLGFLGGTNNLKTSNEKSQQSRQDVNLTRSYSLGLNIHFSAGYLGLDLDAHYGFTPERTIVNPDDDESSKKSIKSYGGLFQVNGQLPFFTGPVRWIPRLGLGYGYEALRDRTADAFGESDTLVSTHGPYASAGFEVEPFSFLILIADYSRSVLGFGEGRQTDSEGETKVKLENPVFDRIRAGVYIRLASHFVVGGQFIQRSLKLRGVGGENGSEEAQQHLLGLLMYEL